MPDGTEAGNPTRSAGEIVAAGPPTGAAAGASGVRVSGTAYRADTRRRVTGAVVVGKVGDLRLPPVFTDDDGDFKLEQVPPGALVVTVLDRYNLPGEAKVDVAGTDVTDLEVLLQRLSDTVDEASGRRFFAFLVAFLLTLVAVYLLLHRYVPEPAAPLSPAAIVLVDRMQAELGNKPSAERKLRLGGLAVNLSTAMTNALASRVDILEPDRRTILSATQAISAAVAGAKTDDAARSLVGLRALIERPPAAAGTWWSREPRRYFEVLMWALAGVLVNLIITCGLYLRQRRFYREGIVMHVSQLVTAPLLVLVVVLLLSLASLTLTVAGGSEIKLDLSDPRILAAVAFLLATLPWSLWDFVRASAERLLARDSAAGRGGGQDRPRQGGGWLGMAHSRKGNLHDQE